MRENNMEVADRPLTVYDAYIRSTEGPKLAESHWDAKVVPEGVACMKEKYDIRFGSEFIPVDRDLKERLFLAGMELLVTTGIYNTDTRRVIKVTESEIMEGIKKAPRKLQLGEYRDAVFMEPRKGNASQKPVIQGGPTGSTVSEDIFIPMIQSYAQEAAVDTVVNGVMATIGGVPSTANTPFEIKATLAEIRGMREACNRAGRPYMAI
jgi:methylamine--corrinoid protein Co-methyltransferase